MVARIKSSSEVDAEVHGEPQSLDQTSDRYLVVNELIKDFKEIKNEQGRFIECGICHLVESNSIVPHMKLQHPEDWIDWVREFKYLRSNGANFKEIMWQFKRLFSWTVIRRELALNDPLLEQFVEVKQFIPKDFKLEDSTLWRFTASGKWATHNHIYPGNWAPQVPRNLLLRYSRVGDTVCDQFVGAGTTLIECMLLGRNAIGVDVNPRAVAISQIRMKNLKREAKRQGHPLPEVAIKVRWGDARKLDFIKNGTIDLICTHPPYMNAIVYTKSRYEDLSRISSLPIYLREMQLVTKECHRVLKKGGRCCFMIGDVLRKGKLLPLGLKIPPLFEAQGFSIEDIIIKEQERTSSKEFYNGLLKRKHEYIFVFFKF